VTAADQFQQLTIAGSHLIAALAEEAALGNRRRKAGQSATLATQRMDARRQVALCEQKYLSCLEAADFPDLKIRKLVEG
jgi:hypothetical protein